MENGQKEFLIIPGKLRYLLIIAVLFLISIFIRMIPFDSESLTGEVLTSLEVAKDLFGSGIKNF